MMKTVGNEAFRKLVISYFKNDAKLSKVKTVEHFTGEGKQRGITYDINDTR